MSSEFLAPRFPALVALLDAPGRDADALDFPQLLGFLYAVASCPEMVPPSEWIPVVSGGEEVVHESLEQARAAMGDLMDLYNIVNRQVIEGGYTLPPDCAPLPEPMDNFAENAPLARWAQGFAAGHQWLEDSWDAFVPEDGQDDTEDQEDALGQEIDACIGVLAFFGSREFAEAIRTDSRNPRAPMEKLAADMLSMLSEALLAYADIGRSLGEAQADLEGEPPMPVRRERPKVGRNEPCPCGSGKKYKRCCGAN